jgi:hypothetical protein
MNEDLNQQRSGTVIFIDAIMLTVHISIISSGNLTFNVAISLIVFESRYFVRMLNISVVPNYRTWCLCFFSVETKCLKEKSAAVLHKYYESKNHQKKQIQTGG